MRRRVVPLVLLVAPALLLACEGVETPSPVTLGELENPQAEFSAIRYWDRDALSLNDRCPMTGTRLNPAIAPVYVNGRPIGFC